MSELDAMEYNGKTHNNDTNSDTTSNNTESTGVGDEELWNDLDTL